VRVHELFDMKGKVGIVTGGATGIGRQMAEALADCGTDLVLCARRTDRCIDAARELSDAFGTRAVGIGCDVRDPAQIAAVVERTVAELGRIDVLVNNAGTTWGAPAVDVPLAGWQKVIDVNLTGAWLFAQLVGRVLIEQGEGGKIINIASIAAFKGGEPGTMDAVPYNASKGGLVSLTIDLAVKWACHGIQVNAIAPGMFPSEMTQSVREHKSAALLDRTPAGRFGGEDDLKGAVAFLASQASDFVTGHTLAVDGGALVG
jgi:NAD(P)-dependent dehydrogenase (short-subunit alcohol dehydrogenase family)